MEVVDSKPRTIGWCALNRNVSLGAYRIVQEFAVVGMFGGSVGELAFRSFIQMIV